MAKYTVKHSCGCSGSVQLYGPGSERERKLSWLKTVPCLDCKRAEEQAAREAENTANAEKAAELGMPGLTGTPKQVAWATTIRQKFIDGWESSMSHIFTAHVTAEKKAFLAETGGPLTIDEGLRVKESTRGLILEWAAGQTAASWWIDMQGDLGHFAKADLAGRTWNIIVAVRTGETVDAVLDDDARRRAEEDRIKREAEAEATLLAEGADSPLVATVSLHKSEIRASYPESHEGFRAAAKLCGFRWKDGIWTARAESPLHRAAELAHRLLAAGINVLAHHSEVRRMAIDGSFENLTTHAVRVTAEGWFLLKWSRKEDWFQQAKRLPGSRWVKGVGMTVPPQAFAEVLDFAELHGFAPDDDARDLARSRQDIAASSIRVQVDAIAEGKQAAGAARLDVPETVEIPAELQD